MISVLGSTKNITHPFLWLIVSCICQISISVQSEILIHSISKLNREVTYENI